MNLESRIEWIELYPSGEEPASGTAQELLMKIVERQPRGRLPPYRSLLDIIWRGMLGGGMGGGLEWSAAEIELSEQSYEELKRQVPGTRWASDCQATTVEEWTAWCAQHDHGVSYSDYLHLLEELRRTKVADEVHSDEATQEAYAGAVASYLAFVSVAFRSG